MTTNFDDEPDTLARFAADLRLLRVNAGSRTLGDLQSATGISRTVLSDAFNGKQLPSARTLDGIVRACGGDAAAWHRRRDALAGAAEDAPAVETAAAAPESATKTSSPQRSRLWTVGIAAFAVGAIVAGVTVSLVDSSRMASAQGRITTLTKQLKAAGPVNPHAQIQVRTGVDPAMTPCVNDAKVAASEDRPNNIRLQIIWSNKCYAGWARLTRSDGKVEGNEINIAVYPDTGRYGVDRQSATEPSAQSAYTMLIVRPSPQTRLCAEGSITIEGREISAGNPICI